MSPKNPSQYPRWMRWITSPAMAAILLILALVEVLGGLWIQSEAGHWDAQRLVFGNWVWGLPLVCALASIHLGFTIPLLWRSRWRDAGMLFAHLAGLVLLGSFLAGVGLAQVSTIDIAVGESVTRGGTPGRWELALEVESREGAGVQTPSVRPLERIAEGTRLDFGEAGIATVAGFQRNGVIGADQFPIPLPRGHVSQLRFPAIALDFVREGALPARIALDGNRPSAELGRGRRIVLRMIVHPLPFTLELVGIGRGVQGGVRSIVRIAGVGGTAREAWIDSRHPSTLGHATVYQVSSRRDEDNRFHSILSVVETPFRKLSFWAMLAVFAGLATQFSMRSAAPLRTAAGLGAILSLVVFATAWSLEAGDDAPWILSIYRLATMLAIGSAIAAHVQLEHLRAGRRDQTPLVGYLLAGSLFATVAEFQILGFAQGGEGAASWEVAFLAALPFLLWGALLFRAKASGWIGPGGFALGAIASLPFAFSMGSPLRDVGFCQGGTASALLAIGIALEAVFLWWVLLSDRCFRGFRAFRLWRIRYVRSRNPRLRRHGGS